MSLADGATIETVRGAIGADLAEELIGFWTSQGVLTSEQGRRRLDEVVCVLRDRDGAIAGANSVFEERVTELGGKAFWRYRSFLPGGAPDAYDAMLTAAFEGLKADYHRDRPEHKVPDDFWAYAGWVAARFGDEQGSPEDPVGLCLFADPGVSASRPEAVWPQSGLLLAGHAEDGRQVRVRYFDEMLDMDLPDYPLEGEYRLQPFAESEVSEEDVLELWREGGVMPREEAERRVAEVDAVGIAGDGSLAGLTTAYLARSDRLRTQMWFLRSFVAPAHRQSKVMTHLSFVSKDRMIERFVAGEDTRGAGLMVEIENPHLERAWPWPVHPISGFTFVGIADSGAYQRLIWFPGARAGDS